MATAVLHCFVSFLSSEVKNPGLFIYAGETCKLIQRNKLFFFFYFQTIFHVFTLVRSSGIQSFVVVGLFSSGCTTAEHQGIEFEISGCFSSEEIFQISLDSFMTIF